MASKFRRVGTPVFQGSEAVCWAAAMEYWLSVTPGRTKMKADELVRLYAKKNPDGSLDPITEWPTVRDENGLMSVNIGSDNLNTTTVLNALDKGNLFLGYEIPGKAFGHCVVIYGIIDDKLQFMDPAIGSFRYRDISAFSGAKMTIAWPSR